MDPKNLILLLEGEKAQELEAYNKSYEKYLSENYGFTKFKNIEDTKIHPLEKLNLKDKNKLLQNILDEKHIDRLLLEHELSTRKIQKNNRKLDLETFKKEAIEIFNRYQGKAGGFLIEDLEWTIYEKNDIVSCLDDCDVKENELLFLNTIKGVDFDNLENELYLDKIVQLLKNLCSNIKVQFRFREGKKDIFYLLIWANDKNIKNTVGL